MRARNIKPGFFENEVMGEMAPETRLLFIGLWLLADREGRLEDRPRRIRAKLLPFDSIDIEPMLDELAINKFLVRYEAEGTRYIQINSFAKHQDPHYRERASVIPPPDGLKNCIIATNITRTQRQAILERDGHKCQYCAAEEQLCIDHVVPVSRGGDSSNKNLQVLCVSCNTKKGNKISSSGQRRVNVGSTKLLDVPLIPDSLIPDSIISSEKIPPKKLDCYPEDFLLFWKSYPGTRRENKPGTLAEWRKAVKLVGKETLMDALARFSKSEKAMGGFAPAPFRWLKNHGWEDEHETKQASTRGMV